MSYFRADKNPNRAEFIDELRRECALRFEPEITDALVSEVDAHIAESIQARLELGDTLEIAEITAVRSFHQPKKFVQSMGQVHREEVDDDRPLFFIGFAFLCWLALWIEMAPKHLGWIVWPAGLFGLLCAFVVRSVQLFGLRRGTLRRLALAAVIVVGIISPLRTVNLWAYGGKGYMPTQMARDLDSDPQGFVQTRLNGGDWPVSYVPNFSEMVGQDIDPAKRALAAPLWERWESNASQTVPSLVVSFGLIFIAHLLPVAIRRRLSRLRVARRGTLA